MEEKIRKYLCIFGITVLLIIGTVTPGTLIFAETNTDNIEESEEIDSIEETIVMVKGVTYEDIDELSEFGEVIDHYGENTLLRTKENDLGYLEESYQIDELNHRNDIFLNGRRLDRDDLTERDQEELLEMYEPGSKGIYLIDLIGPVNSEWREELEEIGVDIMNYVPNYAYRARMTSEVAERVSEFEYVEWLGPYPPEFKVQEGIGEGAIEIGFVEDVEEQTIERLDRKMNIADSERSLDGGSTIIREVETKEEIYDIARMPEVYYIADYQEPELHSEIESQIVGGGLWNMDDEDGDHSDPYRKHGDYGAYINQIGYTGEGTTIAIADTGLGDGQAGDAGHEDFEGRVVDGYSFGSEEDEWQDGHYHGTHTAGLAAGNTYDGTGETYAGEETGPYYLAQGVAYDSELFGMKIFDDEANPVIPADTFEVVEETAKRSDTYVHSNSWGADSMGQYTESDSSYDAAVRDANRETDENEPMVITSSAGNDGPGEQTTGSPGHAKNVITVGATETWVPDGAEYGGNSRDNPDNVVSYSSRGWTADNRIKPDVVAPAELTVSTQTPLSEGSYEPNEEEYRWMGGTSSSNPVVAGAAAVVVEWYEENYGYRPSPAMVRSLLINTAEPLDEEEGNTEPIPNQDEGWGMVDLSKLEYPKDDPIEIYTEDQENIFENSGETNEYELGYDDSDEPLKITLGWTDKEAPADTQENPSLINDLNLEVESPTGHVYRGNAFEEGWTQPNQDVPEEFDRKEDGWDDTNNVQNVYLPSEELEKGIYTVRVKSANIPEDAVGIGETSQDYSLTAYNAVEGEVTGEPPSLEIEYPEEGETWTGHEEKTIEWSASAGDDDLKIINAFYSLDGGESWDIIEEGVDPEEGSILWSVVNKPSDDVQIRLRVTDEEGRFAEEIVDDMKIEGIPPEPPENLLISNTDTATVSVYEDDVSEDRGYTTWTSNENASEWDIRDHGSTVGDNSWDWGNMYFEKITEEGMESRLTSPEIELPDDAEDLELSFDHWRDFGDASIDDGGNLRISTTGEEDDFEIIEPEEGYDGEIESYFGNPLGDEPGWGGTFDWETVNFDLSEYAGETIHLRWNAGVEQLIELFPGIGQGWRIDNIEVTGIFEEEDAHNQLRWYASPDEDIDEVSHYEIYREEEKEGDWNEDSYIDSVPADGSEVYHYEDPFAGEADDDHWWYLVRAVGTNELREENEEIKQETGDPEVDHPEIDIEQPDSEQSWNAHEEEQIEWTTEEGEDDVDYVDLWYSIDAGETWSEIDKFVDDEGTFDWTVANWPSEEALIRGRVVDEFGRHTEDTSEEFFEIIGEPPEPPENLEINHGDVEEEWIWEHPEERRPEVENKVGLNQPGTWYGGIRTELSEGELTEISYFDAEEADSVKGIIYEDGDEEPGDRISETETVTGEGDEEWKELSFEEPLEVTEDHYWLVLEVDDPGEGYQPVGVIDPHVEDAGYISFDGDIWDELPDENLDYSWALEANLMSIDRDGNNDNLISWEASEDDPGEVDRYNVYRSEEEIGPWNESTYVGEVNADGSDDYEYYDLDKGVPDDTAWWYVVRAVGINDLEEDNENAVKESVPPEINITAPEQDDQWYSETQEEITWETTEVENPIDHIDLEYTLGGDHSWEQIAEEVDDTGEYQWEIPHIVDHSDEVQIRATVVDDTGTHDEDVSEEFTIVGEPPESPERVKVEHSGEEEEDNLVTWYPSPDEDDDLVSEYNIYRSEERDGPWEDPIGEIESDGSDSYEFLDEEAAGSPYYWYVVRAVDIYEQEEDNEEAKQEPGDPEYAAPEITIIQPDGGEEWFETTTQDILWETEEGDESIDYIDIWYTADGGEEWALIEKDLEDTGEYEWTVPGEYGNESLIRAEVVDDAGRFDENTSDDYFEILKDETPPTLEIKHPEDGDIFSDDQVTVDWQGEDDKSGISHYEIRLNEEEWIDVEENESYEFEEIADGEHLLEVKAVDNLGNERIESVSFTIDTTPPEIMVNDPVDGTAVSEDEITVLWSGYDETTDIVSYEVWCFENQEFLDVGLRTWHEYNNLEDGTYSTEIRATDVAGNQAEEEVEFTVDTEPPAVDIIGLDEVIEEDRVNVSWEGEYGSSGIDEYEVRLNDRGWTNYDAPELPAQAGELIWEHGEHGGSAETVYEEDGVVYSGADLGPGENGEVIAYNPETGEELWSHFHHEGSVEDVFVQDGVVYSAGFDGSVIAADASDGSFLWQHELHGAGVNSIHVEEDVIYSGSSDGRVIAADTEEGEEVWDHEHHEGMAVFSVHVSDGVVYSSSIVNDIVVAAEAEDGEFIWEHDHHEAMVYPVFEYDGIVYSADDGGWGQPGEVIAVDAEDGELIWRHEHHEGTIYALHVWNGMVFTGSEDDKVIAADAETGDFIWEHEHHDHIVKDLHVTDSVVYSAAEDDMIKAAEAQDIEPEPLYHEFLGIDDGDHTISIRATDHAGNQYTEAVDFTIDTTPPELTIMSPEDGVEELTYQEEYAVEGMTHPEAELWIEDVKVNVSEDGSFSENVTLVEGLNKVELKVEDEAGNADEMEVELLFLPDLQNYLTHDELEDELEGYITQDELTSELDNYLKQTEMEEELKDYVTQDELDDLIAEHGYLTEQDLEELNYLTEEELEEYDYLSEEELSQFEFLTEQDLEELEYLTEEELEEYDYLTEEELENYVTEEYLENYLEQNVFDQYLKEEDLERYVTEDDIEPYVLDEDVEDDVDLARNLGIVGLIIAILALVIAVFIFVVKRSTEKRTEPKDETSEVESEDQWQDEVIDEEVFEETDEALEDENEVFEEETEELDDT